MKTSLNVLIKSKPLLVITSYLMFVLSQLFFSAISNPLYAQDMSLQTPYNGETIDILLKIAGIPGESQVKGHEFEIDVTAVGFSITGQPSQNPQQTITIVQPISKASPTIAYYCLSGKHIKEALITFMKEGTKPLDFYEIKLSDVVILSVTSDSTNSGSYPTETLILSAGRAVWSYTPQKPDGASAGVVTFCWDFVSRRRCN